MPRLRLRETVARLAAFARSDFARHSLIVFAATMLVNALGYAFHFAISRRIGVVQYGVLSALNAGYMISLTFATILATVVVKYAAEYRAESDALAKLHTFVRRLTAFGAAASAVVIGAGLLALRPIASFLRVDDLRAVALTVFIIGLTLSSLPMRAVFQGVEDFPTFAWLTSLESLIKAAVGITLVYLGYGVTGAFAGWAVGSVLSLIVTVIVLFGRYHGRQRAALRIDVRRLAHTMANVSAATLLLTVIGYFDVLIVKHYADPTTAGLYGALSLSGKILLFFVAFVPMIVLPKASRLALAGRSPLPVFLQALGLTAAISAAGLLVYGFAPGLIVTTLAGASFASAAPYVLPYGIAMVLLAALNVVVIYKIGIHRFDFIVPLAVVAVGEIAGISLRHRTLSSVIVVLIVGNAVALAASLFRVNDFVRVRAVVQPSADAA